MQFFQEINKKDLNTPLKLRSTAVVLIAAFVPVRLLKMSIIRVTRVLALLRKAVLILSVTLK